MSHFTALQADAIMAIALDAHLGLDEAQSAALNARLVLAMAAQLGPEAFSACVAQCLQGQQHPLPDSPPQVLQAPMNG